MTTLENTNAVVESAAVVESTETKKATRDPLAKFNELSAEKQDLVNGIVDEVIEKIGGADDIDLALLLGVLDKLNAEKKTARENDKQKQKERKLAEKEKAEENGLLVKEKIAVGDVIDYYMSTAKVTILNAKVLKVTEKSVRITVDADTKVLYNKKETTAGEITGLKLGDKSVAFGKIGKVNGLELAEYLAEEDAE